MSCWQSNKYFVEETFIGDLEGDGTLVRTHTHGNCFENFPWARTISLRFRYDRINAKEHSIEGRSAHSKTRLDRSANFSQNDRRLETHLFARHARCNCRNIDKRGVIPETITPLSSVGRNASSVHGAFELLNFPRGAISSTGKSFPRINIVAVFDTNLQKSPRTGTRLETS